MKHDSLYGSEPISVFEWTDYDEISCAVVAAVSEASGDDPMSIEPLYHTVDTDALNAIFKKPTSSSEIPNGEFTFRYQGYWVVVKAHGRGYLYEDRLQNASLQNPPQFVATDTSN